MKVLSWENSDRLFWLGRYSERAYSTIKLFSNQFDSMIDLKNDEDIEEYAEELKVKLSDLLKGHDAIHII